MANLPHLVPMTPPPPDLAMRLWLQPDRMASLGLTASDIQAAVKHSKR